MRDGRPTVLVTGAGGFIGRRIAALLAPEFDVRAGVTRLPAQRSTPPATEMVVCDVLDPVQLDAALQGVDAVVHCARGPDGRDAVTTDGTRSLLERSRVAGVRKLIFLSSVAVYGAADGVVSETTSPVAPVTGYGAGKQAAEATCRQLAGASLRVAILRPTLVYGPGSALWTEPYLARFASRRWRKLGSRGQGRCNLVHVDDLAGFARFLLRADLPQACMIFNANGPDVPSWNSYLERLNTALGYPELKPPDPFLPIKALAGRGLKLLGRDAHVWPAPWELRHYSWDVTYAMRAATAIGYVPAIDVDQGIETIRVAAAR